MKNIHLQFITHDTGQYQTMEGAKLALEGGCRWIQLRMKKATPSEREQVAIRLKALCRAYNATFIIDDDVALCLKVKADGVHLGLQDMPINEARKRLGPESIIGGTANTFAHVLKHYSAGANYIGCGPFRFTETKQNLSPILGLEGYAKILEQMKRERINLPLVAIGGITRQDIPNLMEIGINGIAVSSSVLQADNPIEEMKQFITLINNYNS